MAFLYAKNISKFAMIELKIGAIMFTGLNIIKFGE